MTWDDVKTTYFKENRGRSSLGQRDWPLLVMSLFFPSNKKSQGMKANGYVRKDTAAQHRWGNEAKTSLKKKKKEEI